MHLGIFLQHYFPYGGLQRDALRLAREAMQAGHEVTLLVASSDGAPPDDVDVRLLRSGGNTNHRKLMYFARDCQPWLERFDASIAFSRVSGADFHFCGDPCARERLFAQRNAITRALPRYRYLLANEEAIFGAASRTHVFFLSAAEPPHFKAAYGLPDHRFTVLPPWLSRPPELERVDIREEFGMPREAPLALFVGSDFERKGLAVAMRAIERTNANLLVCGNDDFAPYASLASPGRVRFAGPRDDVPRLMRGADLLLLPSRNETAGMVLTEALSLHLPAICTRNCGYAPYVEEAGCPVVPANAPPVTLSDAIDTLLENRERIVNSVRRWASDPARYRTADIMLEAMQSRALAAIAD